MAEKSEDIDRELTGNAMQAQNNDEKIPRV